MAAAKDIAIDLVNDDVMASSAIQSRRTIRTMVAACALAGVLAAPAFMPHPDTFVAIVAWPGAPLGEAVRAGIDAGGALVDVRAGGAIAIMAPPATGVFRPRGRIMVMPAPLYALCTDKIGEKRSEHGRIVASFTTS